VYSLNSPSSNSSDDFRGTFRAVDKCFLCAFLLDLADGVEKNEMLCPPFPLLPPSEESSMRMI
jgi:hypothetical protein